IVMEPKFLLATLAGVVGIIFNMIIFQQTERNRMLIWKIIADSVWLMQYLLLGAYAGAGTSIVAIVRSTVFLNRKHKWAQSRLWLFGFLGLALIIGIITWKGSISLFTSFSSFTAIFSFWIGNPSLTRKLNIPSALSMLVYDSFNLSFAGIVNQIMSAASAIIGIIRLDMKKGDLMQIRQDRKPIIK
ncbi:MAG: YgjV family protein, partial [Clostridia bacterium]|nr:YgjV family protein [Clostridia bacterium]